MGNADKFEMIANIYDTRKQARPRHQQILSENGTSVVAIMHHHCVERTVPLTCVLINDSHRNLPPRGYQGYDIFFVSSSHV